MAISFNKFCLFLTANEPCAEMNMLNLSNGSRGVHVLMIKRLHEKLKEKKDQVINLSQYPRVAGQKSYISNNTI